MIHGRFKLLGDPHLGRSFIRGTPLHRRGEREGMQRADFEDSLLKIPEGVDTHVCMGDIFDRWTVPYSVVFYTASIYKQAAQTNPGVKYILLQGNHDASRDMERISAFRILTEILRGVDNIQIVDHITGVLIERNCAFIPWSPITNAHDMVVKHATDIEGCKAAFGHWDVIAIGETDNLVPAATLKALGIEQIITGHDHHKRDMEVEGVPVKITGSMQPYSFAEDEHGDLYITVTKFELESLRPEVYVDKCVRVILQPGEFIEKPIDCLQFRVKHEGVPDEEADVAVNMEEFNFSQEFKTIMDEVEVAPKYRTLAMSRIEDERAKE